MKRIKKLFCALLAVLMAASVCAGLLVSASSFERGDVDGNGEVKAKDYTILKRHILRSYVMSDEEYARADVNLDGEVNAKDYMVLKTVILGTYKFPEEEKTAYSFAAKEGDSYEVAPGAVYSGYTLSSGIYDGTVVDVSALEFNSEDYMVMAYTGHVAGGVATLDEFYDMAVADGYEVVGMINGSFFTVATGIMDEYDVVNGILVCANANNASKFDGMTVLYSDGTLKSVENSELAITLSFNGVEAKNMLTAINKSGGESASGWKDTFYYFDSYSGTMKNDDLSGQILTYQDCPGYEIVCKKETNSELSIGGTLYGKVTAIRENRCGGEVAENEFVLFMRSDSANASVIGGISVGDEVSISVEETVEGAYDVTKDAISVFENPSWLVKDGVNLVEQDSYNNKGYWHNNVYQARWAVFGTKADGSWVFMTSEGGSSGTGGSATLQDVAKAMMDLGCTNVIRMDGGGSVGMYVADAGDGAPGYKQSHSRNVVDCIMVVKRSSPALNGTAKADLETLIKTCESETSKAYTDAVANAKAVLAKETSVSGDYLRAYRELQAVIKAYESLEDAIAQAETLTKDAYAPTVWLSVEQLLSDAKALQSDTNAATKALSETASALLTAVATTGEYKNNVALGKTYTFSSQPNSGYPDSTGNEMTDGLYSSETDGHASGWTGWNTDTDITIDLGEMYDGLNEFNVHALQLNGWGINVPPSIKVYISDDGETFTEVALIPDPEGVDRTKDNIAYDCRLVLDEAVSARYVKFEVKRSGFSFLGELEVIVTEQPYGTQ